MVFSNGTLINDDTIPCASIALCSYSVAVNISTITYFVAMVASINGDHRKGLGTSYAIGGFFWDAHTYYCTFAVRV